MMFTGSIGNIVIKTTQKYAFNNTNHFIIAIIINFSTLNLRIAIHQISELYNIIIERSSHPYLD